MIGIIIQARMGSTRLPGKVLKYLDKDEKVLDILIKRMKMCKQVDEIIIATTPDNTNSLIVNVAKTHNVSYFIGSEDNVLERYYKCASKFNLNTIVRITSDCPFVDPKIVDEMVNFYLQKNYDYINNMHGSSNFPRGFDVEILSFKILESVYSLAKTKSEKEHVTSYIYNHPKKFKIFFYNLESLKKINGLRLTIDEEEDLILCREVFKKLKENGTALDFSIYDVINIIENNPEFLEINKQIRQKMI